jgi:predicted ATPase/DNA-binding SARP family transcriptional activator/Tfp pilus assembly protein PilF
VEFADNAEAYSQCYTLKVLLYSHFKRTTSLTSYHAQGVIRMLEIRLLGRFEIRSEGETVEIPSRPSQSLLAYLVLNTGARLRREKLAGLLWPDSDDTKARRQLRQALWRLRKSIGDEYILVDKITIGFNPDANYILDVDTINDDAAWSRAKDEVVQNISDYASELLPGFYDEWVGFERERLRAVLELQMQLLLNRLLEDQQWAEALRCGECWIAKGEIPEPAYRAVMIAHHGLGDTSRISEVFQRCMDALREELGVDPSAETRLLYESLIREDKPLETPPPTPRHNLRHPMTSFIGREDELDQIRERLVDPSCRLLSLNGPGGIGKTRLALKVAHELLHDFTHGVFFVPLANLNSDELLPPIIADEIGFASHDGEELRTQLLNYLREKEMLLVIDNLEHLLEEVNFLSEILETSPGIKILTTSRERLNLSGEWNIEISGLPYPKRVEIEKFKGYDAVQLFLNRARMISPSYVPSEEDRRSIIRICQLVEGMPLAIELSSAWTQSLTCNEIADAIKENLDFLTTSIRDVPSRQRSLRASFNHSWDLLSDEEQEILQKLTVFRGGFLRQAAKTVAGASLSTLSSLLDKSLLRIADRGRYEIHPLLMQFIDEEFRKSLKKWQLVKGIHSRYFSTFLVERTGHLRGAKQDDALVQIGTEIENIRPALQWLVREEAVEELGNALDVLRVFYDIRGWYQEGEQVLNKIVECLEDNLPPLDEIDTERVSFLGKALAGQAWFCHRLGHREKATSSLQRCLSIARKFGLMDIEADLVDTQAIIALRQGDYQKAEKLFQESLAIWRELGNCWWQAAELSCLTHVARSQDRLLEAKQFSENALTMFRESGSQWGIAGALNARGTITRELGEYEHAKQCHHEALGISREIGYKYGIARASLGLGQVAAQLGNFDQAKKHCQMSLVTFSELGKRIEIPTVLTVLGNIHADHGEFLEAKKCFRDALEIASDIESSPEILRALVGLAPLLAREGEEKKVIQLLRFVLIQPEIKPSDQMKADRLLNELISKISHEDLPVESESMEDVKLSEIAKRILAFSSDIPSTYSKANGECD